MVQSAFSCTASNRYSELGLARVKRCRLWERKPILQFHSLAIRVHDVKIIEALGGPERC